MLTFQAEKNDLEAQELHRQKEECQRIVKAFAGFYNLFVDGYQSWSSSLYLNQFQVRRQAIRTLCDRAVTGSQ